MKKGESMKVLLAVIMAMLIGNSAYAACSVTTPNECTDQNSCEGLSNGVKKFTFVPNGSAKCISSDGPVATNCTENKDGSRGGVVSKTDPKAEKGADGKDISR